MPFTFSHPAFILPFITKQRKWLSVTGLVVGSIVPDFEYFLRMEKGYPYFSHSASSLFYFNLPFGVLLCFLFHGVVRDPLVQNLPNFLRKRFIGVKRMNWMPYFKKHWIQICLSILLGALTHIGWDRFLHVSSDFLYEQQERLSGFVNWQSPSFIYLLNHTIHSLL
ncbi:MAG TPA: DUF4184 family protein, partial [Flavisolibacter sp.]|nr:DUF4184 family protein [Flavisolibacter sp.]